MLVGMKLGELKLLSTVTIDLIPERDREFLKATDFSYKGNEKIGE
jgi:hypothetical protein